MLSFFLIITIIWLVGYLFFRIIIPLLFAGYFKRMTKNMDKKPHNHNKKEGEINIDYIPNKEKTNDSGDMDGEYVNFEEIE